MNKHIAPFEPKLFDRPDETPGTLPSLVAAALLGSVGEIAFVLSTDGIVIDTAVSEASFVKIGRAHV